jgi:hypothetical protein
MIQLCRVVDVCHFTSPGVLDGADAGGVGTATVVAAWMAFAAGLYLLRWLQLPRSRFPLTRIPAESFATDLRASFCCQHQVSRAYTYTAASVCGRPNTMRAQPAAATEKPRDTDGGGPGPEPPAPTA